MADVAAGGGLDPWADWLIRGRDAGLAAEQLQARKRRFQALAGRVLDGARIADADRVLDVGAGTGLIALAAADRTGPGGQVVALDISRDALAECRAGAEGTGYPAVGCVGGDATRLPFPDRPPAEPMRSVQQALHHAPDLDVEPGGGEGPARRHQRPLTWRDRCRVRPGAGSTS